MTPVVEQATARMPDQGEGVGVGSLEELRILVVDDHAGVRAGLRDLLGDQPGLRVLDSVASAEEAVSVAERTDFDVAVVDYQLKGRNGLWLSRKLKRLAHPPKVLIYSAYCDGWLAAAAVVAEADGIVSKGALGSELCDAIRAIAHGHSLLAPMPPYVADVMRELLDDEEQVIFGMSLAGIPAEEIAVTLRIPAPSLESKLAEMVGKLETMAVMPAAAAGSISSAFHGRRFVGNRSSD